MVEAAERRGIVNNAKKDICIDKKVRGGLVVLTWQDRAALEDGFGFAVEGDATDVRAHSVRADGRELLADPKWGSGAGLDDPKAGVPVSALSTSRFDVGAEVVEVTLVNHGEQARVLSVEIVPWFEADR